MTKKRSERYAKAGNATLQNLDLRDVFEGHFEATTTDCLKIVEPKANKEFLGSWLF